MKIDVNNNKKLAIILMSLVICIWGGEYAVARTLMDTFSSVNVLLFKYSTCLIAIGIIRFTVAKGEKTAKRDYPVFLLATFSGIVMYFLFGYNAMDYMPIALVTIVQAFVPIVSILIERVLFKRKMTSKIILGALGSILGVAIVIGPDVDMLLSGRFIGYLLAFGSVASWNAYNFIAEPLSGKYSPIVMGFNQVICAFLLVIPLQIGHLPDLTQFTPSMLVGVLYLGLCSALIGYVVLPIGLKNLGPTISGVFSNFLPVTSTIFGFIILGQAITIIQVIGGVVVIAFSCMVIVEVGKRDKELELGKQ